jgi:hypothetical protein
MAYGDQLPVAGNIEQQCLRRLRAAWNAATPEDCEQLARIFAARTSEGSKEIAVWMREMAEQLWAERAAEDRKTVDDPVHVGERDGDLSG